MQKIYLSAIILLALSTLDFQIVQAKNPTDSIGVENVDGLKVIIHKASLKETYYSIARRYNVSPKEVLLYNDNKYLKVGTIIKVPTKLPFTNTNKNADNSTVSSAYFTYTIAPKDNLNFLAEKYGTTISTLKELNGLSTSNLSIGQVIKIPITEKAKALGEAVNAQETAAPAGSNVVEQTDASIIEHIVKPKEFLNKIAENYGTTVEELKKLNNLSSTHLRIGQKLKIPTHQNKDSTTAVNVPDAGSAPTAVTKEATGTHKVANGENIFTLSKQFGVTAYQIRKANNLDDNNLKIGQVIKIPSNILVDVVVPIDQQAAKVAPEVAAQATSFEYLVANGEDIYSIAKKFNLTTFQIKEANKMVGNNLDVGQKLIIPKPPEPQSVNEASIEEQKEHPDSLTLKDPKLRRDPSVYGLNQVEEKGTGIWIADQDLDGSKMLVLHRTAPIGTVIKITNPMTNISTFAKVVGKFTENESTKDVVIVMTKAVADSLGALDKRFLCELMYSAQ
ncbi:peptidoglycan endopeptidase LytF [Pedobacter sp. UYP30]|uniref:LysM peptidoglycan-binding domain-containing protein n=1 Tax=Pedobacter sp. UYP30 TaxID=1756400 RepID=UPI0033915486